MRLAKYMLKNLYHRNNNYSHVRVSCMQPSPNPVYFVPPTVNQPTQMMSFVDSIKNVLINNYAGFSGRASRSEYWWFSLFSFLAGFTTSLIDATLFGWEMTDPTYLTWLLQLAIILPGLAVSVRRLHDSGKSGWSILIVLVPCVGFIVFLIWLVQDGQPNDNMYGSVPTNII